ncbi:MAG: ABC transporter permease, partial [Myxococcota bacterium]|nr:ABC transporter permease [Myxococcota bacterium]
MSAVRTVLQKEIRQFSRDGRIRIFGAIVLVLALSALAFGGTQTYRAQEARAHAQEKSATQWEAQGEKNPHVAAHYGTHVFAPTSVLTAIDPGVSAYLGRSVKIEAHKRNLASHAAAEDGASIQRMGAFSVASVLLQLVPLLIIALGYGLWTREREGGTLRQLLSTGIARETVFWGKSLGLGCILGVLVGPAALVVALGRGFMGGGHGGTVIRLVLLA